MGRRFGGGANARGVAQGAIINDREFFMGKGGGQPGIHVMAQIAGIRRRNMIYRFARRHQGCGDEAELVTVFARVTADFIVVYGFGNRRPGLRTRLMAGLTVIAGSGMHRRFTRGHHTVMAITTGADHLTVIHIDHLHRFPGQWPRRMTHGASLAGLHVRGTFTAGQTTIVTGDASAEYLQMIDIGGRHWRETRRSFFVAGLALIAAGQMRGRFTNGDDTVMALHAAVHESAVVQLGKRKGDGAMAGIALGVGHGMIGRLSPRTHIIMTGTAYPKHLRMIKTTRRQRLPESRRRIVTGSALIRCRQMVHRFARRPTAVVTYAAIAGDFFMIDHKFGRPGNGAVACGAIV